MPPCRKRAYAKPPVVLCPSCKKIACECTVPYQGPAVIWRPGDFG